MKKMLVKDQYKDQYNSIITEINLLFYNKLYKTSIFTVDQRFLIHRTFFSLIGALDKSEAAVGAALEAAGVSTGPGADGTVSF